MGFGWFWGLGLFWSAFLFARSVFFFCSIWCWFKLVVLLLFLFDLPSTSRLKRLVCFKAVERIGCLARLVLKVDINGLLLVLH